MDNSNYTENENINKTEVRTSVRDLVEFLCRNGDISSGSSRGSDSAMLEGSRIHRRIQKEAGPEYRAEVPLLYTSIHEEYTLTLDGRADGLYFDHEKSMYTVDEIKTTLRNVDRIKEPDVLHLSQARCYAYMFLAESGKVDDDHDDHKRKPLLLKEEDTAVTAVWDHIQIRITYVNRDTENMRYFYEVLKLPELKDWFEILLEEFDKWILFKIHWKQQRNESIGRMVFPFPFREGQKKLMSGIYTSLQQEKNMFINAPTGAGKTIASVYPSLKAVGSGMADKIFYLTAKTVTAGVALDTLELLRPQLSLKSLILTAKDKICPMENKECDPALCERAKGHFDRINDAIFELLTEVDSVTREVIEEFAEKNCVCPFEYSLDLSLFCDMIICDYNYAFDPRASLKRFFAADRGETYIFLIDEAHNLPERAREMFSASLCKEYAAELKKKIRGYPMVSAIVSKLTGLNKAFLEKKRETGELTVIHEIDALVNSLTSLRKEIEVYLEDHDRSRRFLLEGDAKTSGSNDDGKSQETSAGEVHSMILEFYFEVCAFLDIYEGLNEKYIIYSVFDDNGRFSIKLFCVDPSDRIREKLELARAAILFSATLLPIQYFKGLLGGIPEDYEMYADSVFDPSRRGIFIASDATSRYSRRNDNEYRKIAGYIHTFAMGKSGNYMVFFPSYAFLNSVWQVFESDYYNGEQYDCILQKGHMNESEREEFIDRFRHNSDKGLIGFCIMGGVFGEGIDLIGKSLIGVMVVGTGIPQISQERELLLRFFDESRGRGKGYEYAYSIPGMNKVMQAAGRLIRSESDFGAILLLDDRFLTPEYRGMFPREWRNFTIVDRNSFKEKLDVFWDNMKKVENMCE